MVIHKNILIAALVLLFVAPAPVRAFDVMEDGWGNELSWSKTNIPWYLHPSGSADVSFTELQSAISSAFQEWKSTSCFTKNFTYGGAQNNDPQNGIYVRFQETTWDPVVGDAAAYAQTWKSGGNISHAVVMFNGKDLQWTVSEASDYFSSKSDIQGVATHEFGHCLGLDHSVHLEATMYFSGGSAELRSLETDDKNGICYLYGNFTQGQPCDSCSSDANCASGYCLQYPDGDHYCGKNCTSDANCSENFYCYDMPSGSDQCVSYNSYCNQMGSNIPVGSYCWGHETCASGICLVLPGVAYCSKECSSDSQCTNGLKCIAGYCIKGGNTPLGGDCQSHMDCKSGLCMGLGFGEAICTQECDGPSGCPSGFGCNNGYCFAGGAGDYGSPCDTDMQCASVSCYNIGGGEKICTFLCETKSDCPNQDNCTNTLCIPKGSGAFGEDCDSHMDCQTGYCAGYGSGKFCSFQCSLDSQCPSGSECNLSGYCSKPDVVIQGCLSDAGCSSDEFCKPSGTPAENGTCVDKCNPFADLGCSASQGCKWYYDKADDSVFGECVPASGTGDVWESCSVISAPCKVSLVCVNVGGAGQRCHKDCDIRNGLGCSSDEACLGLGISTDPWHGVCVCNAVGCDEPDLPDPDVVESDEPDVTSEEDLGGFPDEGGGGTLDIGSGGEDTGVGPDEADPGGGSSNVSPGSGGCGTAGNPGQSAGLLLLLLLALALRCGRARTRRSGRAA